MWLAFFIKEFIFVCGTSFLGYKISTYLKKNNFIWGYRIMSLLTFLICVLLFRETMKNFYYINDFKNISPHHITKILINDSLYYDNQEKFVEELKRGTYYFQSHRVQNIRKEWKVKIHTQEDEFNILIEDTYKYGYTIYLIRDINEVIYYKNNHIGKFLK